MKKIMSCSILIILVFAINGLAQSKRKKPIKKTAVVSYVEARLSKNGGIVILKMNNKKIEFVCDDFVQPFQCSLPPYSEKVYKKGARWRIVYSYLTPDHGTGTTVSYYFLWNAEYMGKK